MLAWQTWSQSKTYHKLPSDLLGVTDPLARYYFDRGIYWFGRFVEGEMDTAEKIAGKGKRNAEPFIASARQRTFNKLMGIKDSTAGFKKVKNPNAMSHTELFSKPPGMPK